MGSIKCAQKSCARVLRCPTLLLRSKDVPQHESGIVNCISERSVFFNLSQLGHQTKLTLLIIYRVVWVLAILALSSIFCYCISTFLVKYYEYPTGTKVVVHRSASMEFPAVTICSGNRIRLSYLKDKPLLSSALKDVSFLSTRHDRLNYSDPDIIEELNKVIMADLHSESKHKIDEMFLTCSWQMGGVNCSDLFNDSVILGTPCYIFNSQEQIEERGPLNVTRTDELGAIRVILNAQTDQYTIESNLGAGTGIYVSKEYRELHTPVKCLVRFCFSKRSEMLFLTINRYH